MGPVGTVGSGNMNVNVGVDDNNNNRIRRGSGSSGTIILNGQPVLSSTQPQIL